MEVPVHQIVDMRLLGCELQQVVDVVVRHGVTFRWLTRLGTPGAFRVDGCLDKVEYGRLISDLSRTR